ncbi:serine/threonine protein kinase [Leuconostoc mesenteroides P45]|uniref:APC family permease n=1 Tax=Leuconostoc mesenteroides TaxID=1245 RepID=UPI000504316E|nr:APC family permease [Leuconostoc mesenteroides]KGB49697.1 serine/threonine protein kinase [Leuconostoc mesenteroides P45]
MGNNEQKLNRGFGLTASLALVVGTIIGSGIFFKQGSVLESAGSTNAAMLAWIAGGLLTLASGISVAEIGSQMDKTGGMYIYIEKIYGTVWGFLAGWMQVVFYGPAMMGSIAAYFGLLFVDLFGLSKSLAIPAAIIALSFVGLINSIPNRFSAGFQIITTTVKMLPIIALIIFGLFFGQHDAIGQTVAQVSQSGQGGFGVAVLATLFAYDGWVTLANISGEIKNPQKVLPKAIIFGILIVLVAYVGVSFGVYQSLPANTIVKLGQNTTLYMATNAFGIIGGRLLSIAVLISLLGTLNGKIVSFPRVLFAMANDGLFPFAKQFAKINMRSRTPNKSIWFIIFLGILMIVFTNPDRLTDIAIFTTFLFYILVFVGVFKLRKKDPLGEKRSFSMPLYPWIPIVAVCGSLYVEISEIIHDLSGVIISIAIVAVGYPVYIFLSRRTNKE